MAPIRSMKISTRAKSQGKGKEIERELQTASDSGDMKGPVFHLFPKLPIELRLKIWRLNSPEPCVITQLEPYGYKPLHTIMVSRPTPAVLHVCRESRNEFMCRNNDPVQVNPERPLYRPFFIDGRSKIVFFSFEVDALHLMSVRAAESLVKNELRHLVLGAPMPPANINLSDLMTAIPVTSLKIDENFWGVACFNHTRFKKLETLIILTHPAEPYWSRAGQEVMATRLHNLKVQSPESSIPNVIFKTLN